VYIFGSKSLKSPLEYKIHPEPRQIRAGKIYKVYQYNSNNKVVSRMFSLEYYEMLLCKRFDLSIHLKLKSRQTPNQAISGDEPY
jgi:hypothetical protein